MLSVFVAFWCPRVDIDILTIRHLRLATRSTKTLARTVLIRWFAMDHWFIDISQ